MLNKMQLVEEAKHSFLGKEGKKNGAQGEEIFKKMDSFIP